MNSYNRNEKKHISDKTFKRVILIAILVLAVVCIVLAAIYIFKKGNNDTIPPVDEIAESTQYWDTVYEYRKEQEAIYQTANDDLDDNTLYHADGSVTYYEDYMESDYPDMTLDKYYEYAMEHGDVLECDFIGTNMYILLVYALNQVNIDNGYDDTYTCMTDSDVQEIKTAMIYQCAALGNKGHSVIATIDCSNAKVRIDEVN